MYLCSVAIHPPRIPIIWECMRISWRSGHSPVWSLLRGPAMSSVKGKKCHCKGLGNFQKGIYGCISYRRLPYQSGRLVEVAGATAWTRALCLKWKPVISGEELVSGILNNILPRVIGFSETLCTVNQLVKVGLMVKKDCMGAKNYWRKVGNRKSKKKAHKRTDRGFSKSLAGFSVAQPCAVTMFFLVSVSEGEKLVNAVLDT